MTAALALALIGCGESGSRETSSPTPGTARVVDVAEGVRLMPGDDGHLPVKVTWVRRFDVPDAIAIDDAVAYVYDPGTGLIAIRLSDGATKWNSGPEYGEGIGSSGGVVIGLAGAGRVRAWAPDETDLEVNRSNGKILRLRPADGRDVPPGMTPFASMLAPAYDFVDHANLLEARDSAGAVAWRIEIDTPNSSNLAPLAIPGGGLLLALSSGDVVRLDEV